MNHTNKHFSAIYKVFRLLNNIPDIKNSSGATYNNFLFGLNPTNCRYYDKSGKLRKLREGWWGANFNKHIKNTTDTYDLNTDNYNKDVIEQIIRIQSDLYKDHLAPLYIELYRIVKERYDAGNPVYQNELGRLLKIPETFYTNKGSKNYMIQELIGRAAISGLVIVDKKKKLYIIPGDINKVPKNYYSYELLKDKKSKPEKCVQLYLKTIDNITFKTQFRIASLRRAAYDYFVNIGNGIYLLIEVQGEQHYKYIPYFHTTYENFLKRLKFDEKKKNYAIEAGYHYLAITSDEINENKACQKLINCINCINSLRVKYKN